MGERKKKEERRKKKEERKKNFPFARGKWDNGCNL